MEICNPVTQTLKDLLTREELEALIESHKLSATLKEVTAGTGGPERWELIHWTLHELPYLLGEVENKAARLSSTNADPLAIGEASAGIQDMHFVTDLLANELYGLPAEVVLNEFLTGLDGVRPGRGGEVHDLAHLSKDLRSRSLKCALAAEYATAYVLLRSSMEAAITGIVEAAMSVGSIRDEMNIWIKGKKMGRKEAAFRLKGVLDMLDNPPFSQVLAWLENARIIGSANQLAEKWAQLSEYVHSRIDRHDVKRAIEAGIPIEDMQTNPDLGLLRSVLDEILKMNDWIIQAYMGVISAAVPISPDAKPSPTREAVDASMLRLGRLHGSGTLLRQLQTEADKLRSQ